MVEIVMRLQSADMAILTLLLDHRMATGEQLARILGRNQRALSRRMTSLECENIVRTFQADASGSRGRPPMVYTLSEAGVDILVDRDAVSTDIADAILERTEPRQVNHHLAINNFRIALASIGTRYPELTLDALDTGSPCTFAKDDELVPKMTLEGCDGREVRPDVVTCIADRARAKPLLFFVEVDRGTEPIVRERGSSIRQKVETYRQLFREGGHLSWQAFWDRPFKGFRVLFVCHTPKRAMSIGRALAPGPSSDFFWITDEDKLEAAGIAGHIWMRGGACDASLESMLGSHAERPLPC